MAGAEHAAEVLELLRAADLPNNIVFEFFALPPASFLRDIDRCVRNWSMEFSPESHEQAVRDAQEGESRLHHARTWRTSSRKRYACAARESIFSS
jgi:hypothetical protein